MCTVQGDSLQWECEHTSEVSCLLSQDGCNLKDRTAINRSLRQKGNLTISPPRELTKGIRIILGDGKFQASSYMIRFFLKFKFIASGPM